MVRRGAAYLYLTLLAATTLAIAVMAVIAVYEARPANTALAGEIQDRITNVTVLQATAHYCAARISIDEYVGSQPGTTLEYNLTGAFRFYAAVSNISRPAPLVCYNLEKTSSSQTKTLSGITATVNVIPANMSFDERLGRVFTHGEYTTRTLVEASLKYSLGVADFNVTVYYANRLVLFLPQGGELLNTSIPIKLVRSTSYSGNRTASYPVSVEKSDRPGYDWKISTSLVLDPTAPSTYTINIDLLLFDGVKQRIQIIVQWSS